MKTLHSLVAGLEVVRLMLAQRIAIPLLVLGAALILVQPCDATSDDFVNTGSDPTGGSWTATGSMGTTRYSHTATLLPSGQVLVAGGYAGRSLSSAELYDPTSGTWTATGSMGIGRYDHTATLLPSGKVLVTGGTNGAYAIWRSAELYDPATGLWTATVSMSTKRISHTATLLPSGKVLVSGGYNNADRYLSSAELS